MEYEYKCSSCGQPYNVTEDGKYPMKDTFTRKCPSCGKELKYKSCCMDVEWYFDPKFNKNAVK